MSEQKTINLSKLTQELTNELQAKVNDLEAFAQKHGVGLMVFVTHQSAMKVTIEDKQTFISGEANNYIGGANVQHLDPRIADLMLLAAAIGENDESVLSAEGNPLENIRKTFMAELHHIVQQAPAGESTRVYVPEKDDYIFVPSEKH